MARVRSSPSRHSRRKKWLKAAKGYWGGRHRLYRTSRESVMRAWAFAYRDRRRRKGDFRRLWISRINAACRAQNLNYSSFLNGLRRAGVVVNRKILAELAVSDEEAFSKLIQLAKENLKMGRDSS